MLGTGLVDQNNNARIFPAGLFGSGYKDVLGPCLSQDEIQQLLAYAAPVSIT